jgi:hypothetical protein
MGRLLNGYENRLMRTGFSMKYIIAILFTASLLTMGMVATANNMRIGSEDEYGDSLGYLITGETHFYTGYVLQTSQGMGITTNRGTYLLRWPGVEGLAGKTVRVRGVLRGKAIFAMTIDVKS